MFAPNRTLVRSLAAHEAARTAGGLRSPNVGGRIAAPTHASPSYAQLCVWPVSL